MKSAVVVPTYDRPDALKACLTALMRLDPAPDSIVVVDDGGKWFAASVCADFGDRVTCIRQANVGPAAARNAGVRQVQAEVVALTDDDCLPRSDWLGRLLAAHAGVAGRMVGGRVENALADNIYSAASQSLCDYLYAASVGEGREAGFFTTNNLAFDRAFFERIGGFDESFPRAAAEDRDLGLRWRAAGGQLLYTPEAVIDHAHHMDFRGFWRQQSNYGRGVRQLETRMAARKATDKPFSKPNFYARLVTHPLRDGGASPLTRSALLALAQLATVWGYARERIGK